MKRDATTREAMQGLPEIEAMSLGQLLYFVLINEEEIPKTEKAGDRPIFEILRSPSSDAVAAR
jgi:hypothetical protein